MRYGTILPRVQFRYCHNLFSHLMCTRTYTYLRIRSATRLQRRGTTSPTSVNRVVIVEQSLQMAVGGRPLKWQTINIIFTDGLTCTRIWDMYPTPSPSLSLSNGSPGCMSPIENWYDPSKRSRCSSAVNLMKRCAAFASSFWNPWTAKDGECYKTTFTGRAKRWRGRRPRFIYMNYRMICGTR